MRIATKIAGSQYARRDLEAFNGVCRSDGDLAGRQWWPPANYGG
jgi:hypothetical protein